MLRTILNRKESQLLKDEKSALERLQLALAGFDVTPEDQKTLQRSLQQLDELFLLVVVGEFNSGKSALINALLGERFLPEEADRTNRFIRRLIGEPFASILDEHVARTIDELGGIQTAGRLLIEFARVEVSTIIGSLGFNTRVTEITGVRI